jgi:hypothetical protein
MKQRFHTVDGQGAMHTGDGGRDPGAAMVLPKIEFYYANTRLKLVLLR